MLIDSERLKQDIFTFMPERSEVLLIVDNQPDAVVRCKDCRYWKDNNGGYPNPDCPWGKDETPDPDDYCSFGERKEGE